MDHPSVCRATPAHRARVIETVVAAFDQDPAFRYFFADRTAFTDQARTFAAYLFDKRVSAGTVWIVADGSAVAMWDGPRDADSPLEPHTAAVALALPDDAMARLDAYDAAVHKALPAAPHWYLGVLATHPSAAGRRWGRAVMAEGLRHAALDGVPAYLETTNPNNVGLYQRAGWQVTAERVVGDLPVWVMRQ